MTIIQFIIGDGQSFTPLDGSNNFSYNLPCYFIIIKSGYGPMFEGLDFTRQYNNQGILLSGIGVFSTNEKYTIIY